MSRHLITVLLLGLAASALARPIEETVPTDNPPAPQVRPRYIESHAHAPRVRAHYIRQARNLSRVHYIRSHAHAPRVRSHYIPGAPQPVAKVRELRRTPDGPLVEVVDITERRPRFERKADQPRAAHMREARRQQVRSDGRPRTAGQLYRKSAELTGYRPRIKLKGRAAKQRLHEIMRAKVFEELNITRFSPPGDVQRAEALVPGRVRRALRDGSALDLLAEEGSGMRARLARR